MAELKVCRICLRAEGKMYQLNQYQLKFYYEEVMAIKTDEQDGLPRYFCYECATILHKFHKFKEKCFVGQKVLKQLLWKGPITYESVYKIDRKETMLMTLFATQMENISYDGDNIITPSNITIIDKIETDYSSDRYHSDAEDPINELTDDEKINNSHEKIHNEKIIVKEEIFSNNDENAKIIIETPKLDNENKVEECVTATVFLEPENGIINVDSNKPSKNKRQSRNKRIPNSHSLKVKSKWKTIMLNEKDALKRFKEKGEDPKYLAAKFKCTDCFKWFSKKDIMDRHMQLRHAKELGNYECAFCGYRFKQMYGVNKHMKQHFTRFDCLRCDFTCVLEASALLHEEFHSGMTRKCTFCNEEFRYSSTYYTHLRTHRSKHVCTYCGASFVSELGLTQHKQIKHVIVEIESPDDDEEVNTYCERCKIRFETRKAYEEHFFHSALHNDNEPLEPMGNDDEIDSDADESEKVTYPPSKKILGKKEKAKITNTLRKRKNNDDSSNFALCTKIKRGKHYRKSKKKPTTCHQCGMHFDTQAACMKHHIEAHPRTSFHPPNERYICEICGSSLAPGSIQTHQNMHTREKLHTCDTCGRQFHAYIGLKRHMVTHTGEKPYGCPLCEKKFTQSNSMKLHYKTFHLKQPYPKRNRRKNKDQPKEASESNSEESMDSIPDHRERADVPSDANRTEESVHYLTLP